MNKELQTGARPEAQAVLEAQATLDMPAASVRQWFLELEEHPERYQFETHAGFRFVEGGFGEVGARFQTTERFAGIETTLDFELLSVDGYRFDFAVLRPPVPVWGAFVIEPLGTSQTRLRLLVGGKSVLGNAVLRLPLLHGAVQRQIQREIDHIAQSI